MKAVVAISKNGFTPYGGAKKAFYSRAPEVIVSGPFDTGKTLSLLQKLNLLMALHDKSRALMIRKTYTSIVESAIVTWDKKVHRNQFEEDAAGYPVKKIGGEHPQAYKYPNGSRIVVGGLDKPGKTLSTEYDFVYVNQAEELTEDEWQVLTRAASGRAGNAPFSQVMGDCNPDVPEHWILKRGRLELYESRHEENPDLFDQETGEITPEGRKRLAALDAMTGVRYKRGRLGQWVGREGQVYEFDRAVHLIDRFEPPDNWRWLAVVDFGYTNPFGFQLWALDPDDRLYLYREIYMTGRTVARHTKDIDDMVGGRRLLDIIADHDAEDRATLAEHGYSTTAADKRMLVGIEKVQERLKPAGDGKPRLFIMRDALWEKDHTLEADRRPTCTEEEFPGYVWPERKAGRAADERPVKSDDHGMDEIRYAVMYLDGSGGKLQVF